jgi:transcriptional regulator with XRE-family HTH domain
MSDFGSELERLMRARGVSVRELHRRAGYSTGYISQLRRGLRRPSADAARDLDDALGAGGELAASAAAREERSPVRRRTFIGLTSASALATALPPDSGADADSLALALTDLGVQGPEEPAEDIRTLAASADAARRAYQACRYSQLVGDIPRLIRRLEVSCAQLGGSDGDRAHALSADVHHVAASLMLKRGDRGLASVAADRSMRAALASGDPVAIAGSARIVTHALMDGGHQSTAVATAASYASRLGRDVPCPSPASLSVYGALLLRGAVAAALSDNRHAAHELLAEAEDAARQLGHESNHRWTAFGPVNATLHRISIAVTLGDAGTAIDLARRIDIRTITVTERKAALLIDTARAFLQRGRHDSAYIALREAHETAPEEVAGRSAVRTLVRDLAATAPQTVRRDAARFAADIGVTL